VPPVVYRGVKASSFQSQSLWYHEAVGQATEVVLRCFTEVVIELLESVNIGSINLPGVTVALAEVRRTKYTSVLYCSELCSTRAVL